MGWGTRKQHGIPTGEERDVQTSDRKLGGLSEYAGEYTSHLSDHAVGGVGGGCFEGGV